MPMPPQYASVVTAVTIMPVVVGTEKRNSRRPVWRERMRGGASDSRSALVSMLRVTNGRLRVRRTSTATAWHTKWVP